jgi:hypothetical protein
VLLTVHNPATRATTDSEGDPHVSDNGNEHPEIQRRLELALAAGAQALTARISHPQNRTSEEWLRALTTTLTELIRAASRYIDAENPAPSEAKVRGRGTARPALTVPGPRQSGQAAAVLVSR